MTNSDNMKKAIEIVLGIGSLEETSDFVVLEQTIAKALDQSQREILDKVIPFLELIIDDNWPEGIENQNYDLLLEYYADKTRELSAELRKIGGKG